MLRQLVAGLSIVGALGLAGFATDARAQGWAEQRPVQFRYADQGQTNEVYRAQLGVSGSAAAAAVAASSGLGGGAGGVGSLQTSDQVSNSIVVNPTNTGNGDIYLNVTITGTTQNTSDSSQTSTNQTQSQTLRRGGSATILNN